MRKETRKNTFFVRYPIHFVSYITEMLDASHAANWVTYVTGKEYTTYDGTFPVHSSMLVDERVFALKETLEECDADEECAGFTFDPRDNTVLKRHRRVLLDPDRLEKHSHVKTYVNLDRDSEAVLDSAKKVYWYSHS